MSQLSRKRWGETFVKQDGVRVMPKCPKCHHNFSTGYADEFLRANRTEEPCPACGHVFVWIDHPTDQQIAQTKKVQQEEKLLYEDEQDRKAMWSHYPTLRVLKSVFWIAGILTGIGGSLILFQTGAWPVFISTTISAIVLLSVPEILLILVRIERSLASIDGKLTDK